MCIIPACQGFYVQLSIFTSQIYTILILHQISQAGVSLPRWHSGLGDKGRFDPDAAVARIGLFDKKSRRPEAGVWANEDYWAARFPDPRKAGLSIGHPMHAFKKGYLIVFAVAGIVNQAVLTGKDGRRILVKGHVRKTVHKSTTDDGMEIVEKQTDRFESSLWCLDLETMELILIETGEGAHVGWSVEHEAMTMNEFLTNFGDSLMEQVTRLNAPRYQRPDQVPRAKQALSQVKRTPQGKQLDVILAHVHALVNRWQEGDIDEDELLERIAVVAEMACGKTYIAMVSAFLADLYACGVAHLATKNTRVLPFFPTIVLSPSIMAPSGSVNLNRRFPTHGSSLLSDLVQREATRTRTTRTFRLRHEHRRFPMPELPSANSTLDLPARLLA